MNAPINLASLSWQSLDALLGNYEDCNASVVIAHACELVGASEPEVIGWCRIDSDRTAFKIAIDDTHGFGEAVWIVTMDCDGAPDGRSKATRVEVVRQ